MIREDTLKKDSSVEAVVEDIKEIVAAKDVLAVSATCLLVLSLP